MERSGWSRMGRRKDGQERSLQSGDKCPESSEFKPLTAFGARRQTAPTDRDLFVVKEMQRRISALRARTNLGQTRGASTRLRSLPLSGAGTQSATLKDASTSSGSNGSTSSVEERVRSLLEAAKRWTTSRNNSVELAVAWASEDELEADDDPSSAMGPAAGSQTAVVGESSNNGSVRGQVPGVEHWGDILNSVSPANSRCEQPLASIRLAATGKSQRGVAIRNSCSSPLATDGPSLADRPAVTVEGNPAPPPEPAAPPAATAGSSNHSTGRHKKRSQTADSDSSSEDENTTILRRRKARHGWDIIRKTVYAISPFLRIYKSRLGWIQIAGHSGSFLAGADPGTILKRETPRELKAFQELQDDALVEFVPKFFQSMIVEDRGTYLCMQDLLADHQAPIVMDVKMGIRTYLEDELGKPGAVPAYRADLYKKMVAVDPSAASEDERARRAITKARYMQFREHMSSSATLGFRIDGIKLQTGLPMRDFKHVREECDVENRFLQYLSGSVPLWSNCLDKLVAFREACMHSDFLTDHEVVGSSLLFVGEPDTGNAGVWMIDFGKTMKVSSDIKLNHFDDWELGNHEDGYLRGLDNLIRIWIGLHDRVVSAALQDAIGISPALSEEDVGPGTADGMRSIEEETQTLNGVGSQQDSTSTTTRTSAAC